MLVVSKNPQRSSIVAIAGSMGWPLLWGLTLCSVFYVLLYQGPLDTPFMHRYFASHPVAFAEVAMFCVGVAALALKLVNVAAQYSWLDRIGLGNNGNRLLSIDQCSDLLDGIAALPTVARRSYLGKRLHDALESVERKGSAEGLEDELKYLADLDAARQQESYALVRIISWATPMLGFLGTVIGITQALGDLEPAEMANSIESAMNGFTAGLYVAFDTTTVALSLSIVLMFMQFAVDKFESQLVETVDDRVAAELVGRFEQVGTSSDPSAASIERSGQAVVRVVEQLVQRQAELWRESMQAAQEKWSGMADATGRQNQQVIIQALAESLEHHAQTLVRSEQEAGDRVEQRWQQWLDALSSNTALIESQQSEMAKQSQMLAQVVNATGNVITLERSLNENLKALAGAGNFEETVMSLSAAIHLLTARLGPQPHAAAEVDLSGPVKDRAA